MTNSWNAALYTLEQILNDIKPLIPESSHKAVWNVMLEYSGRFSGAFKFADHPACRQCKGCGHELIDCHRCNGSGYEPYKSI